MSGMLMLADIARGDEEVKDRETASATAPDRIADWVVILNEWRHANYQPMQNIDPPGASASQKVSRDDSCPWARGRNTRNAAAQLTATALTGGLRYEYIEDAIAIPRRPSGQMLFSF